MFLAHLKMKIKLSSGELDWDEKILLDYYDKPVDYSSNNLFLSIAIKVCLFLKFHFMSCLSIAISHDYLYYF